jgi:DNA-binding NtrC family response regulator
MAVAGRGAAMASAKVAHARSSRRSVVPVSLREIADRASAEAERQAIRLALHATHGNKSEAARLLRTDYKTLHLKMKRYAIHAADFLFS